MSRGEGEREEGVGGKRVEVRGKGRRGLEVKELR